MLIDKDDYYFILWLRDTTIYRMRTQTIRRIKKELKKLYLNYEGWSLDEWKEIKKIVCIKKVDIKELIKHKPIFEYYHNYGASNDVEFNVNKPLTFYTDEIIKPELRVIKWIY